jgi:hypothetical protein
VRALMFVYSFCGSEGKKRPDDADWAGCGTIHIEHGHPGQETEKDLT